MGGSDSCKRYQQTNAVTLGAEVEAKGKKKCSKNFIKGSLDHTNKMSFRCKVSKKIHFSFISPYYNLKININDLDQ